MGTNNIKIKPIINEKPENNYPKILTIISASKCAKIRIGDIETIEQEGRVLHIYTADKDYSIYESINTLAEILDPSCFYRPLKTMLINFDRVTEISNELIGFDSGRIATLGRNKLSMAKGAFRKYLIDYPPFVSNKEALKVAEETLRS